MFYYLHTFSEVFSPFRIFRYITVRTFAAAGMAFLLSLVLGPVLIRWLKKLEIRQQIRSDPSMEGHRSKSDTPTMGGLLILSAALISTLCWALPNQYVLLSLATMVYLGTVGFLDDWLKIKRQNADGLREHCKLLLQGLWVTLILFYLWQVPETRIRAQQLFLPFLKNPVVSAMGFAVTGLFLFGVLAGASNAVNLADGLDGLAIGCSNPAVLAYLVMAYAAGHSEFAQYLQIPYVAGAGELSIFCGALLGAGLGFLWYNAHPALIFMGDTGSLAIGGSLAIVAILTKQELTLLIVGGVFVIQALSVLLQRGWFKYTRIRQGEGKRIFLVAPLHHHFEKLEELRAKREGRAEQDVESRIVARFCILALIFALAGIATLKIR